MPTAFLSVVVAAEADEDLQQMTWRARGGAMGACQQQSPSCACGCQGMDLQHCASLYGGPWAGGIAMHDRAFVTVLTCLRSLDLLLPAPLGLLGTGLLCKPSWPASSMP